MDREKHKKIMTTFLSELNKKSNDFVLKGGTALFLCYNLDRFSTDIDLDSHNSLAAFIKSFCYTYDYKYYIKKSTDTVERYSIHYDIDSEDIMLKIELSHRQYNANQFKKVVINDIATYDINSLFSMKLAAGLNRTKIRDFYDICFIFNNYYNELSTANIAVLDAFLNEKGQNYFEYLLKDQGNDEVIDINKFEDMYLKMLISFNNVNGNNIIKKDNGR